jgi:purine-binding chemotaxis protein CheW
MMKKNQEKLDIKDIDLNALGLEAKSGGEVILSPVVGQYMTLNVGKKLYAIDIKAVQEIHEWTIVTPIPNTHEYMLGVLNLRGVIVPIFDLKCRFGNGLTKPSETHVIVIAKVGKRIMGLLVDVVSDIITVHEDQRKPIQKNSKRADKAFLKNLFQIGKDKAGEISVDSLFDLKAVLAKPKSKKSRVNKKKS